MKFSVIIPVYNAEETLRRCVDSLLEQNRTDAEIILINDGSTDNSGAICGEYAESHPNVRYISQKNAGVSSARNTGLDAAKGECILFVDSDDYVLPDYFRSIDRLVNSKCADLIQLSYCFDNGKNVIQSTHKPISAGSRVELMPHIIDAMCRKGINVPWAKVYKHEIIDAHNIRFPTGVSVGEDRAFNIAYSLHISSYLRSEITVYVNNTENVHSLSRRQHDDYQEQLVITEEYLNRKIEASAVSNIEKEQYRRAIDFDNCIGIYHDAKLLIQDHTGWVTRQRRLFQLCRSINKKHMKYPNTRYCRLITLPIRLYLTPVIDALARRLVKRS